MINFAFWSVTVTKWTKMDSIHKLRQVKPGPSTVRSRCSAEVRPVYKEPRYSGILTGYYNKQVFIKAFHQLAWQLDPCPSEIFEFSLKVSSSGPSK